MKNPIVELVQEELAWFRQARTEYPDLYPAQDNLFPVPFFGNIRRLDVLTLGLNPALTEFIPERSWPPNQNTLERTAPLLTTRLLNYFDLPEPEQHDWFDNLEKALLYIGCSYTHNAAHLDLLSHPTNWPAGLGAQLARDFAALVNRHETYLKSVLKLIQQPKLILVVNYRVRGENADGTRVWDKFRTQIGAIGGQTEFDGQTAPIVIRDSPQSLAEAVFQKRRELSAYLINGPRLTFCTNE